MFAEIYDNVPARDRREIEVTTSLVGEDGSAAMTARDSLPRSDARNSRFPVVKQIPLTGVKPGRYRLRVEARLLGASSIKPVTRETTVTIAN